MAMSIKEVAAMVAGAKVSGGGNYITAGRGTLVVSEWLYKPEAFNGPTLICAFKVESSFDLPGAVDENGKTVRANAPGTTCSFSRMIGAGKNQDFFLGQVKALIDTLDGGETEDLGALIEQIAAVVAKDGSQTTPAASCAGMRVNYEATLGKSKKGEPVTNIKWHAFPNDEASIKTGRAFLDVV